MQIGWKSLEAAYEHYVFHEPYGLMELNSEFERLRLAAIAGGKESHDAILAYLAAFQPSESPMGSNLSRLQAKTLRASPSLFQEHGYSGLVTNLNRR